MGSHWDGPSLLRVRFEDELEVRLGRLVDAGLDHVRARRRPVLHVATRHSSLQQHAESGYSTLQFAQHVAMQCTTAATLQRSAARYNTLSLTENIWSSVTIIGFISACSVKVLAVLVAHGSTRELNGVAVPTV